LRAAVQALSVSRNSAYNFLGSLIPLGLSIVTVPIYLSLIGPDRYGVLAICWLLLGYFGLFDLGLGRATSYRMAALRDAPPGARSDTFWAAITVNAGMGVIGGLALWAAGAFFFAHVFKVSERLRPEILAGVPLLATSVPVATLIGVLTGSLQGREKFLQTNVVSTLSTAFFQLFPLATVLVFGPNLVLLLCGALCARLVAIVVLALQCHSEITRGLPVRVERTEIRTLLRYGGWVTGTSIVGPVLFMTDRFVIGAILGASSVAAYTVPYQLASRMQILPGALLGALFPRLSAAAAEQQAILGEKATRALACALSPFVFGAVFVIEPFLQLWVGRSLGGYSGAVGRILLVAFWANAFALVPFTRLQASGRPALVTKILLLEIPLYLGGLYVAMVYLGFLGSAIALLGRLVLDYLLLTWAADRNFSGLRILMPYFALLALAAIFAGLWPPTDYRWWLCLALGEAATLVLSWRTLPPDVRVQVVKRGRSLMPKSLLADG
jgi:O-antigen/teichoic acid export membrane protein